MQEDPTVFSGCVDDTPLLSPPPSTNGLGAAVAASRTVFRVWPEETKVGDGLHHHHQHQHHYLTDRNGKNRGRTGSVLRCRRELGRISGVWKLVEDTRNEMDGIRKA